jgi:hypothetical protein
MFGSSPYSNRKVDAVYWTDKNGVVWAKAITAEAACQLGMAPFKAHFSLSGDFVGVPR